MRFLTERRERRREEFDAKVLNAIDNLGGTGHTRNISRKIGELKVKNPSLFRVADSLDRLAEKGKVNSRYDSSHVMIVYSRTPQE